MPPLTTPPVPITRSLASQVFGEEAQQAWTKKPEILPGSSIGSFYHRALAVVLEDGGEDGLDAVGKGGHVRHNIKTLKLLTGMFHVALAGPVVEESDLTMGVAAADYQHWYL